MPGKGKYTTYSPVKTEGGKGKSNSERLKRLFKTRPTEIDSEASLLATANEKMLASKNNGLQKGDPLHFKDGVSLQFSNAPDVEKVVVGGGGLPSSPYTPNLTSPGEGHGLNPTFQQDMEDAAALEKLNSNAQQGVNGLINPVKESKKMAQSVILGEDLALGKRPGSDK